MNFPARALGQPAPREKRLAESVAGTPIPEFSRVRSTPEQGGRLGVTGPVPEHEAEHLALARAQGLHRAVHPPLHGLKSTDRPDWPPRFLGESLAEPAPPHRRPAVVGDHPTSDTEKPETIFRRRWDHRKTAPGDEKYLRDHVLDVVLDHAATDIRGD